MSTYKPLNKKELDEIWERISTEIDIDEVWGGISSGLDTIMPEDSSFGIISRTVAAILILLIGFLPVTRKVLEIQEITKSDILIETGKSDESSLNQNKKISGFDKGDQNKEYKSQAKKEFKINSKRDNEATPSESNLIIAAQESLIPDSNKIVSNAFAACQTNVSQLADSSRNLLIDRLAIQQSLVSVPPEKIVVTPKTDFENLRETNNSPDFVSFQQYFRGKISIGITPLFKNTWLLNKETFDGLKPETLITTKIVFLPDVGLSLKYSINRTWQLQADGFFYSKTGQKYNEYIYGHYSSKRITLRYSTLALSVRQRFAAGGLFSPGTSIIFFQGIYLSALIQADQRINSDISNIGSQYRKYDIGLRIGGEIDMPVAQKLSIAPGVSLSSGIFNINKDLGNIPDNLHTRICTGSVHIAFYFHLIE